jgi:tripartite-type tricarboxylate transporter receptor subunit TctC
MQNEIRAALSVTHVQERFAGLGCDPVGNSPAEFKAFVQRAIERAAALVRIAGIEPE